jgi:5-methylcytosine-specific restriction endonuclease McrA
MDLPTFQTRRPEKKPTARGREYQAFLRSRVWKETAKRILHRDRFLCRLRYSDVCTGRATTVHHVTYERFGGNEYDVDLVAACSACNLLERERRIVSRVMGGGVD